MDKPFNKGDVVEHRKGVVFSSKLLTVTYCRRGKCESGWLVNVRAANGKISQGWDSGWFRKYEGTTLAPKKLKKRKSNENRIW